MGYCYKHCKTYFGTNCPECSDTSDIFQIHKEVEPIKPRYEIDMLSDTKPIELPKPKPYISSEALRAEAIKDPQFIWEKKIDPTPIPDHFTDPPKFEPMIKPQPPLILHNTEPYMPLRKKKPLF